MTWRQRGLQHMISTKDKLLNSYHPANILWDQFLKDCERAINMSELHLDEWSTGDAFLADEERKTNRDQYVRLHSVVFVFIYFLY